MQADSGFILAGLAGREIETVCSSAIASWKIVDLVGEAGAEGEDGRCTWFTVMSRTGGKQ